MTNRVHSTCVYILDLLDPIYRSKYCLFGMAFARDFVRKDGGGPFEYKKLTREHVGHFLTWGMESFLGFSFRNCTNPLVLVALTAIAMYVVAVCFYPAVMLGWIFTVVPPLEHIMTPHFFYVATYISIQSNLLGFGLRTWGRLANDDLKGPYEKNEIVPLWPGSPIRYMP